MRTRGTGDAGKIAKGIVVQELKVLRRVSNFNLGSKEEVGGDIM